jgi:hypothetical protein
MRSETVAGRGVRLFLVSPASSGEPNPAGDRRVISATHGCAAGSIIAAVIRGVTRRGRFLPRERPSPCDFPSRFLSPRRFVTRYPSGMLRRDRNQASIMSVSDIWVGAGAPTGGSMRCCVAIPTGGLMRHSGGFVGGGGGSAAHATAPKTRDTARSDATREAHLDTPRISPPRQPSGRRMGGRPQRMRVAFSEVRLSRDHRRRCEQQVGLVFHTAQVFSNCFQRFRREVPFGGRLLQIRQCGQRAGHVARSL